MLKGHPVPDDVIVKIVVQAIRYRRKHLELVGVDTSLVVERSLIKNRQKHE